MNPYRRAMILHSMLAALGVLLILRADRLSDTPIVFILIGMFCIFLALGKMILIHQCMKEELDEQDEKKEL